LRTQDELQKENKTLQGKIAEHMAQQQKANQDQASLLAAQKDLEKREKEQSKKETGSQARENEQKTQKEELIKLRETNKKDGIKIIEQDKLLTNLRDKLTKEETKRVANRSEQLANTKTLEDQKQKLIEEEQFKKKLENELEQLQVLVVAAELK
jgi:hypothetical protein